MARNFRGVKFSLFSWIFDEPPKFYPEIFKQALRCGSCSCQSSKILPSKFFTILHPRNFYSSKISGYTVQNIRGASPRFVYLLAFASADSSLCTLQTEHVHCMLPLVQYSSPFRWGLCSNYYLCKLSLVYPFSVVLRLLANLAACILCPPIQVSYIFWQINCVVDVCYIEFNLLG